MRLASRSTTPHAGFNVGLGGRGSETGMQESARGHRDNIHNTSFKEVGIGIRLRGGESVPL